MGQFNTNDGFPILETLADGLVYRWNHFTRQVITTSLNKADRYIDFDQAMLLVGQLMKSTESTYCEASDNDWMIWFPYLFSEPSAGDKILNERTKEVYTIKEILRDSATKRWQGHILLEEGQSGPKWRDRDILSFINNERYIKYTEEMPDSLIGREKQSNAGHGTNLPPMKPTISNVLLREEPAAHKKPFSNNLKEIRPRYRESMNDPVYTGYTLEFFGQILDSLVQFDCWAADPTTSRSLARWFTNFMNMNRWILKKNGVVEIMFWAKVRDQNTMQYGQDAHARSVQYLFRTEHIDVIRTKNINNINASINVKKDIESERQDVYIAGQYIPADELTPSFRKSLFYDEECNPRFGRVSLIDNGMEI